MALASGALGHQLALPLRDAMTSSLLPSSARPQTGPLSSSTTGGSSPHGLAPLPQQHPASRDVTPTPRDGAGSVDPASLKLFGVHVVGLNARDGVLRTIGKTPMLFLNRVTAGCVGQVVVKLETANPSGFAYDRVALAMIQARERTGALKPGQPATLISAGPTPFAASLAMVGGLQGYNVLAVVCETEGLELRCLLRSYGAEVVLSAAARG
eukprot:RCo045392